MDCARDRLVEYLGAESYSPQQQYWFEIDATDPKLLRLLQDDEDKKRGGRELYQLLHHTYTYGAKSCLLIVGTNTKMVYVVEVKFSSTLLRSYKKTLLLLYERYYSFLYSTTFNKRTFPTKKVKAALEKMNEGKVKGDRVTWHAFHTNYLLWRSLNVDVDSRAIRFPLPPIDGFIPCQNAEWNLSKGPSDTLTKLFDDCEEAITVRTPQTVAVARFISVLFTAFHRSLQIVDSKEDLAKYKTLENFRRAANNRTSFKSSILQLAKFLWNDQQVLERQEAAALAPPRPAFRQLPVTPTARRNTRNTTSVPTQVWNMKWRTGVTPSKHSRGRPGQIKQQNIEEHKQRREHCIGVVLCVQSELRRCELCGTKTQYYCSGCRSALCFQTGNNMISDTKIKKIKSTLKLPAEYNIPKHYNLSEYNPDNNDRTEIKILNSCYHVAHSKQFTSFFSTQNGISDESNSDDDENSNGTF